jgi:hypothetical protein
MDMMVMVVMMTVMRRVMVVVVMMTAMRRIMVMTVMRRVVVVVMTAVRRVMVVMMGIVRRVMVVMMTVVRHVMVVVMTVVWHVMVVVMGIVRRVVVRDMVGLCTQIDHGVKTADAAALVALKLKFPAVYVQHTQLPPQFVRIHPQINQRPQSHIPGYTSKAIKM